MSFDDAIKLSSSDKFYMMRLKGHRIFNINNAAQYDSYLHGDGVTTIYLWRATCPTKLYFESFSFWDVTLIENPMSEVTNITALDGSTYYAYSFDDETGELIFSHTSDEILNDETFLLKYELFFTSFTGKRAVRELGPLSPAGPSVYYDPRLPLDFDLNFSQSNNLFGQLSISVSSVGLKNEDGYFNQFFTRNDSFSNKEVKVWRCVNDVENVSFEFLGVVKDIRLTDKEMTLSIADVLDKLEEPIPLVYYSSQDGTGSYSFRDQDLTRPLRTFYGPYSPYDMQAYVTGLTVEPRIAAGGKTSIATCSRYDLTKSTSTNRRWTCGIASNSTANVTATITATSGAFPFNTLTASASLEDILMSGDTFQLSTFYGHVLTVQGNQCIVSGDAIPGGTTGTLTRVKVPAVVVRRGDEQWFPRGGEDYTVGIDGAGETSIIFVNDFEANHPGMTTLDPDTDEVYFRLRQDGTQDTASELAKAFLDAAGIATSSVAFAPDQTPAWTDPVLTVSVPLPGSETAPSYREIIEKILGSTLSSIYLDANGLMRYRSLLDQTSTIHPGKIPRMLSQKRAQESLM